MDDQFGGRTDDDLFADEFEPVEHVQQQVPQEPAPAQVPIASEPPAPTAPAAPSPVPVAAPQPQPQPNPTPASNPRSPSPPRGLASSRFANATPPASTPRAPRAHRSNHPQNTNNHHAATANPNKSSSPAPAQPSTPRAEGAAPERRHHHNKPGSHTERMSSGGNPRTKLTDDELADKMRKMAIINAERAAKFKQEEADRQSHEVALVKASEQAKKRRAEDAERKKREAVDRRQMDDERERNRVRKLKAMESKSGGSWDEGKDERELEEERRRGGFNFRGANGGVRGGVARDGGLAGSRFAAATADTDFMTGHESGSGRGRGGRRGRDNRGGHGRDEYFGAPQHGNASSASPAKPKSLSTEEFPALPGTSGQAPKIKTTEPVVKADLTTPLSPLGNWGDEMEAQDEKKARVES